MTSDMPFNSGTVKVTYDVRGGSVYVTPFVGLQQGRVSLEFDMGSVSQFIFKTSDFGTLRLNRIGDPVYTSK